MDLRHPKAITRIYVTPLAFTEVTVRSLGKKMVPAAQTGRIKTGEEAVRRAIESLVLVRQTPSGSRVLKKEIAPAEDIGGGASLGSNVESQTL